MSGAADLAVLAARHQEGLALAGLLQQGATDRESWSRERDTRRRRAVDFFDRCWAVQLNAEERHLVPLIEKHLSPQSDMLALLRKQHQQLRSLAHQLRGARGIQLENLLLRFGHVLEEHIRKEAVLLRRLYRDVPGPELAQCARRLEEQMR